MARIKLDLPKEFIFSTALHVRVTDLNYGGHVGNDSILSIAHEARLRFIQYLGFKDEVSIEDTVGIVVADAAVVYKSEAFYNDELVIKIGVDDFNKYGFDMYYEITNAKSGLEVARAKTGIVCLDYETRKLAMVPESLKKVIST